MGKFLNPRLATAVAALPRVQASPVAVVQPAGEIRVSALAALGEPASMFHTIGCWALALCLLSAQANDWMLRLVGEKAYLYWIAYPAAVIALIVCGSGFRGLRTTAGKLWLVLGVWLLVDLPFSYWRSGSWDVVRSYLSRGLLIFFLACAFGITVRHVKFLANMATVGAFVLLAAAATFGANTEAMGGRFGIPKSAFFENPNDLAIELIVDIGFFAYLALKRNPLAKVAGVGGIGLASFFLLKTASRGAFLASVALLVVAFVTSRAKWKLMAAMFPVLLAVPLIQQQTLGRLLQIFTNPEEYATPMSEMAGAAESQLERQHLLWLSLTVTAKHPLFGVGPGEFIDATSGADQRRGLHSPALGTHDTYTQISSETGILPFFCFTGILWLTVRSALRLHKRTRGIPELGDVSAMAYGLFLSTTGFAFAIFFHHVGYSATLPLLAGLTAALQMGSERLLARKAA